jgi:regulator of sigma E protease
VTTFLSFLFVLGVLVFVHELGHFLAARRVGIRVLTFSLGFGPKLLKYKRGDTEYCISALPLGGYVKMAGEAADEPRSGAPDEFMSKTKWQRFQVLIMGPVMNILLAIGLLTIVLAQENKVPEYQLQPVVVGAVNADSPAARAGIGPGDRIIRIGDQPIATWEDYARRIVPVPGSEVELTYIPNAAQAERTVRVRMAADPTEPQLGTIGIKPDSYPVIQSVVAGEPAEAAGVMVGDAVVAVDGERVVFTSELSQAIEKKAGVPVTLTVRRNGQEQQIAVTPADRDGKGRIGVGLMQPTATKDLSVGGALVQSVSDIYHSSGVIFSVLGGLFTGENSVRQLQGPIKIAQMSGEAAGISILALLHFMAMLSLNLGLLNLLPIPVLDGGHILIMGLEGIARRDFSMQLKERMLMAGFVLLMVLMVTVFYNDLAGLVR